MPAPARNASKSMFPFAWSSIAQKWPVAANCSAPWPLAIGRRMRVLILGGSGFIGTAVASLLARHGHSVVALVRRNSVRRGMQPGIDWDRSRHRPSFEPVGLAPAARRRGCGGQLRRRVAGRRARRRRGRAVRSNEGSLRGGASPRRPDLGAHRWTCLGNSIPRHQAAGGHSACSLGRRVRHLAPGSGRRTQRAWRLGPAARRLPPSR